MANRRQSEGIRIVGDFVCEAIPDSSIPAEKPISRGRNEGVHVIGDFVVDLGSRGTDDRKQDDGQTMAIGVSDVANPISPSWVSLFFGRNSRSGLQQFGWRCVKGSRGRRHASANSRLRRGMLAVRSFWGRVQFAMLPVACEQCLGRMLSPPLKAGVGFQCAFCGHAHTEAVSA